MYFLPLTLGDVPMLLQRISSALQIPAPADADERILREGLFSALAPRAVAVYITQQQARAPRKPEWLAAT